MKKSIVSLFAFMTLVCTSFIGQAQTPKTVVKVPAIEVIQFHSEHRCMTCLKIEKLTRATLANNFKTLPFRLVNVEEKKNEKLAEQFQATGTALFLYNSKTGKKKDLTEFAFMKAGDEKAFDVELKKQIKDFINS